MKKKLLGVIHNRWANLLKCGLGQCTAPYDRTELLDNSNYKRFKEASFSEELVHLATAKANIIAPQGHT